MFCDKVQSFLERTGNKDIAILLTILLFNLNRAK